VKLFKLALKITHTGWQIIPTFIHKAFLHDLKSGMFCAIGATSIIGPIFVADKIKSHKKYSGQILPLPVAQ